MSSDAGKTIGPHYFQSSLILKSKQAKIFDNESLRNMLCLPIPAKLLAAIVSQIFVIYKKGNRSLALPSQRLSVFCMESTLVFHNFADPFPGSHIRRFSLRRFHLWLLSSWESSPLQKRIVATEGIDILALPCVYVTDCPW